jgi:hypothetical protein
MHGRCGLIGQAHHDERPKNNNSHRALARFLKRGDPAVAWNHESGGMGPFARLALAAFIGYFRDLQPL